MSRRAGAPANYRAVDAVLSGEQHGFIAQRIFNLLCLHPYGLSTSQLIDMLWGDDIDGGPEWANNCISVSLHNFNKAAAERKMGLRIKQYSRNLDRAVIGGGRGGSCYRIFIVCDQ